MRVQSKILLLLLGVVVLFVGGLAALRLSEREKFRHIAEQRAQERNQIFDQFLSERGDNLKVLVEDFTVWDDMVRAVVKRDGSWLESNLSDQTLVTSKANALWLFNANREPLIARNNRYAESLQTFPIPLDVLPLLMAKERRCHFFCKVPQGWMEIRGATIHPSRDPDRETTPQGYLFAGYIWIDESIKQMAAFTGYNIQIVSAEQKSPPPVSAEERGLIAFSRTLTGWDGQPIAQLRVEHDSPIIRELNLASQRLLEYLIIFAVGFSLLISLSLYLWVRRPLRLISRSLRREDPAALERLQKKRNEFGELSKLILRSRQTEADLEKTEELLRHSQKLEAVGRLAGGVAHDFNNLLTAIIGYADLLQTKLDQGSDCHEHAQLIHQAGEQAAGLTRQLLAFSRKQLLQPVVLDLNRLLQQMEKLLQRVIGEHITIRLHCGADDARVLADPGQLEQVILNLGVNARDAMPTGGTLLFFTKNATLANFTGVDDVDMLAQGPYVQLCVSDSGCGMDEETRARIFEPFFTTKGPGRGTGLGLATVYGIVKQSGGGISVESKVGEGSTFCIYLPHVTSPLEQAKEMLRQAPHEPSGETILVVEDEEVVRGLLCTVLEEAGYRLLCAGSPQEAFRTVAGHEGAIHLLVSDVILPEMHGPAMAKEVAKGHPEMRVLFVSGYSENDISDQGVLEPGVEVLQKPFTQHSLVRKVREVLDAAAAARDAAVAKEPR